LLPEPKEREYHDGQRPLPRTRTIAPSFFSGLCS